MVQVGIDRVPRQRTSRTVSIQIAGSAGEVTVTRDAAGAPREVFVALGKHGSTVAGMAEALGSAASVGLGRGAVLDDFLDAFTTAGIEPGVLLS